MSGLKGKKMNVNKALLDQMPEVGFGLIMGDIRSGKSVLGYGLLEDLGFKYDRDMLVYGLPKEKVYLLPDHIKPVYKVSELKEYSVVLFDEAYKEFYSREWQKNPNKLIDTMAGLAGQKEMLGIFITHQSRKLEVGVVSALQFLLYKKPSLLQHRFERPQIRSLTVEVYEALKKYSRKEARKHAYVFFPDYVGLVLNSNNPPEWWSEELSKAYAHVSITPVEVEDVSLGKRVLCLHCNRPAIGICSYCQCSVCEEHAKTLHSHGKVLPLSSLSYLK